MISVLRLGRRITVTNPITGKETKLVNVVFVEEGRPGSTSQMGLTSEFLSQLTGEDIGLSNLRVHTHPIAEDKIDLFPVGKKFNGYINRGLYSTPQLEQQVNVAPRMINGQPTFFVTWIAGSPSDDVDKRVSNEVLMAVNPDGVLKANLRAATVRLTEQPAAQPIAAPVVHEDLAQNQP